MMEDQLARENANEQEQEITHFHLDEGAFVGMNARPIHHATQRTRDDLSILPDELNMTRRVAVLGFQLARRPSRRRRTIGRVEEYRFILAEQLQNRVYGRVTTRKTPIRVVACGVIGQVPLEAWR